MRHRWRRSKTNYLLRIFLHFTSIRPADDAVKEVGCGMCRKALSSSMSEMALRQPKGKLREVYTHTHTQKVDCKRMGVIDGGGLVLNGIRKEESRNDVMCKVRWKVSPTLWQFQKCTYRNQTKRLTKCGEGNDAQNIGMTISRWEEGAVMWPKMTLHGGLYGTTRKTCWRRCFLKEIPNRPKVAKQNHQIKKVSSMRCKYSHTHTPTYPVTISQMKPPFY